MVQFQLHFWFIQVYSFEIIFHFFQSMTTLEYLRSDPGPVSGVAPLSGNPPKQGSFSRVSPGQLSHIQTIWHPSGLFSLGIRNNTHNTYVSHIPHIRILYFYFLYRTFLIIMYTFVYHYLFPLPR